MGAGDDRDSAAMPPIDQNPIYYAGGDTHLAPSTTFAAGDPVSVSTPSEFEIDHPNGYSIRLFSSGEEGDSFQYQEESSIPISGDIVRVEIWDDQDHKYFVLTGPFHDANLADFWTTLQDPALGAKAALDNLVSGGFAIPVSWQMTGSGETDYVETYGPGGSYDMEAGASFLAVSYDFQTVYADGGTDTITILDSGFASLFLHAGAPPGDPSTPPSQPVTINFAAAGTLSFSQPEQIEGFSNVHFVFSAASGGQFIYLTTNNLPAVFDVQGSFSGDPNEIVILPQGDVATTLNLSSVTVANFSRLDQAFVFDFRENTSNNSIVGVSGARNVFEVGSGNNTVHGGSHADVFEAGHGHDLFKGGGGVDMAIFDGASTHFHISKVPGTHRWTVHDNRAGSPDGTVTLVNVEYLSFTNRAPIFIGGSTSAASVNHTAHHLALAAHTDFDLHV